MCERRDSNSHELTLVPKTSASAIPPLSRERAMGIEPTAFCLASRHSTSELRPRVRAVSGPLLVIFLTPFRNVRRTLSYSSISFRKKDTAIFCLL